MRKMIKAATNLSIVVSKIYISRNPMKKFTLKKKKKNFSGNSKDMFWGEVVGGEGNGACGSA